LAKRHSVDDGWLFLPFVASSCTRQACSAIFSPTGYEAIHNAGKSRLEHIPTRTLRSVPYSESLEKKCMASKQYLTIQLQSVTSVSNIFQLLNMGTPTVWSLTHSSYVCWNTPNFTPILYIYHAAYNEHFKVHRSTITSMSSPTWVKLVNTQLIISLTHGSLKVL